MRRHGHLLTVLGMCRKMRPEDVSKSLGEMNGWALVHQASRGFGV